MVTTGACWPNAAQEQLLRACFLPGEAVDLHDMDDASRSFLALWYHRRGHDSPDPEIAALGQRAWLSLWQQSLQRCSVAASMVRELDQAGIACLLLKGMALVLRHYRNPAVRPMGDIDLLVRDGEAAVAIDTLRRAGWRPEDGLSTAEILGQMRVRHAWQFDRGDEESCDLHWRPVVRCYAPRVTELFWLDAESVEIRDVQARVPGPACQLFHVCAHGLQWSWSSPIRWVPDALTVLESSPNLDWDRVLELARAANMSIRLSSALRYLQTRFDAPIPAVVLNARSTAPRWEKREYALLQKPCPLGALDAVRWHLTHFRRLRPYDAAWKSRNWCAAFAEYLAAFLNVSGPRALPAALWRQLRLRWGRE